VVLHMIHQHLLQQVIGSCFLGSMEFHNTPHV
jgi:hypothetical protein